MARKRVLTENEEFQIMKLVLDKFLWIGTVFLGLGLYNVVMGGLHTGLWLIATGGALMLVFAWIIVKQFELVR